MDRRCPGINLQQPLQGLDKQQAVLPFALHMVNAPRLDIQSPADIPLDVLARRHHLFLLAAVHPVRTDLGVQVNVHLVKIDRHFIRPIPSIARRIAARRLFLQAFDHGHSTLGLGAPRRAPIIFNARLIVAG